MQDSLAGLRVLDLTQGFAGPFGVKQLADQGADVVKVEKPGGDPMRQAGPFRGDVVDPEQGGLFLYLNTNRRGVVLDLKQARDREVFRRLVARADLVVESYRPGTLERLGLGFETLVSWNPRVSLVSLSNFGETGPYRDWELIELVSFALSGPMYSSGLPGREPLASTENATLGYAGLALAAAALAAVVASRRDGRGHRVATSIAEAFLAGGERQPLPYFYNGEIPRRIGDPLRAQFPDGRVCVQGWLRRRAGDRTRGFVVAPGLSHDGDARAVERSAFRERRGDRAHKAEFDLVWDDWLMRHTRREIFDAAAAARFPMAPVYSAADMPLDPHFEARGIFETIEHPAAGPVRQPTKPFRLHGARSLPSRPAPLLGQHQAEVLAELETLERAGTKSSTSSSMGAAATATAPSPSRSVLPLAGLRVLELAEGWAGPMTGMWLGDLGAEVIKLEAVQRFDHARGPVDVPPSLASFYPGRDPDRGPTTSTRGSSRRTATSSA